jgi:myo-inositol-1(or 4)-monophosphatase
VSEVDLAVERAVREFLSSRTPGLGFLGEEGGPSGDQSSALTWVFDPVDGTANFLHDMPLCAVSLGLVSSSGDPVLGVIDLPFLGARYTAVRGQGAYRDGRRIRVRKPTHLGEAIVAVGDYAVGGAQAEETNRVQLVLTGHLAERVQRIRMLGSAAIDLVWVAEGKLDASVIFANNSWDISAGVVIASEAGAVVTDIDGSPHTPDSVGTVTVTKPLAGELLDLIGKARRNTV